MVKKFFLILISLLIGAFVALCLWLYLPWPHSAVTHVYGVTWSPAYARYLGIDSVDGLRQVMGDLGLKQIRLPTYWTDIEPAQGQFDWTDLDAHLDVIKQQQGSVLMVVGAKQPRWPECWVPSWVKVLSPSARDQAQLDYVDAVVRRYANSSVVQAWQVENESGFLFSTFGDCANDHPALLSEEMDRIRSLEQELHVAQKPIVTTTSGELSTWLFFPKTLDGFGVSVYRTVVNPQLGVLHYWFLTPQTYARRALLTGHPVRSTFVDELQMEPWVTQDIRTTSFANQVKTFSVKDMQSNFAYAQDLGFSKIYFWGAEWWLWMKAQGHPEFWQAAQAFFHK